MSEETGRHQMNVETMTTADCIRYMARAWAFISAHHRETSPAATDEEIDAMTAATMREKFGA
jgi:hypothetical protein